METLNRNDVMRKRAIFLIESPTLVRYKIWHIGRNGIGGYREREFTNLERVPLMYKNSAIGSDAFSGGFDVPQYVNESMYPPILMSKPAIHGALGFSDPSSLLISRHYRKVKYQIWHLSRSGTVGYIVREFKSTDPIPLVYINSAIGSDAFSGGFDVPKYKLGPNESYPPPQEIFQ